MNCFFIASIESMHENYKKDLIDKFKTIHIYSWSDGSHITGIYADIGILMNYFEECKKKHIDDDICFQIPSLHIVQKDYKIAHQNQTIFEAFRKSYYQNRVLTFKVGKKYRRYDGLIVTIIKNNDVPDIKREVDYHIYENNPFYPEEYECVMGDDVSSYYDEFTEVLGEQNIWRYNRKNDAGRVCGSNHDMSDSRNLYPEEVED